MAFSLGRTQMSTFWHQKLLMTVHTNCKDYLDCQGGSLMLTSCRRLWNDAHQRSKWEGVHEEKECGKRNQRKGLAWKKSAQNSSCRQCWAIKISCFFATFFLKWLFIQVEVFDVEVNIWKKFEEFCWIKKSMKFW